MTLAKELGQKTLETIVNRFKLVEIGDPYRVINSQMPPGAPVGEMRIWGGESINKLVYVGISVPPIGLDSHMLFAFTPPESGVPHFTLDSVLAGPTFAFHLDLLPRLDLGANLPYIDLAFQPLTAEYDKVRQIPGITEARLSPRQFAIMSPWMLAHRASEEAYRQVEPSIDFYLKHWISLVENGIPEKILAGTNPQQLAARDRKNRAIIFNPDVDKVWGQLEPMIGAEMGAEMRAVLMSQDIENI